ncbi:hypothetical protein [Ralstonia solanacearum]|uniref:hypothetical protein n=1 Tax=Ralstonia solanacearum TaxID=305 RepID=UPI00399D70F3
MSSEDLPLVRNKIPRVIGRTCFMANGPLGKSVVTILDQYARDELLQIGRDDLHDIALALLRVQKCQCRRMFVGREPFEWFASSMVFVSREKFNTHSWVSIQTLL